MSKFYFHTIDSEMCFTENYFQGKMIDEQLQEIEVYEANIMYHSGYMYCSEYETAGETGICDKTCKDYIPRNGKSGVCKHHRVPYEHVEKVILKRKS